MVYPTGNGIFRVDLSISSLNMYQTLYNEVLGADFTYFELKSFITIEAEMNLIRLTLQPST